VSDDEVTLEMSIPLDSNGFLRRECPTCVREFKWLHTPQEEGNAAPVAEGGYYCPYCGVQAEAGTWLTQAQADLAQNMVAAKVVGPMLEKLGDGFKSVGRQSGGFIKAELEYDPPEELDPLTEIDDMIRDDFECHPTEPVKVLDDSDKSVHCLICGQVNV
jgi:hypothetical protein